MLLFPAWAAEPQAARSRLESALASGACRPDDIERRHALWEICQACGDPEAALAHQSRAIASDPLRSRAGPEGATPERVVLAIAAPGDFRANLPLDLLLDDRTELHTLFLADPDATGRDPSALVARLGPLAGRIDAVFVVIAEDPRQRAHLAAADRLIDRLGRPAINRGAAIAAMSRVEVSHRLAGVEDCIVPLHTQTSAASIAARAVFAPFIVRPVCSHAGVGLARIASREQARDYLRTGPSAESFTLAPFVDYRSPDGLYRKFRVVFVDGVPHPLHLAIHDDWAVWYYNAGMDRHPDRLAEEARFLADMTGWLGLRATAALARLGRRIDLDVFGIDAGVMPDGRLVLFEIETGMIVSDACRDPGGPLPARAIAAAVERLIDHGRATGPVHAVAASSGRAVRRSAGR